MAKDIIINGVTYSGVTKLSIPVSGGGSEAIFPDTSDAVATAADILADRTAYVNGVKVVGTGTGGSTVGVTTMNVKRQRGSDTIYYVDATGSLVSKTINRNGFVDGTSYVSVLKGTLVFSVSNDPGTFTRDELEVSLFANGAVEIKHEDDYTLFRVTGNVALCSI